MLQLHIKNYNTAEELMVALHCKYSDHLFVFS